MKRIIFFISDSTGITVEGLGRSLLSQFDQVQFETFSITYVNTQERAEQALVQINEACQREGERPIVFSSLVNPNIRRILSNCQAIFFDIFDLFVDKLENELHSLPSQAMGKAHGVTDAKIYESRIHAIHFALDTDDGADTKQYDLADVILVGVSRSGKTPTSLYLAIQFGIRAANYPLTEENLSSFALPGVLTSHQKRLFGLTISPQRLHVIREERFPNSRYASLSQCQSELKQVVSLFEKHAIPYLDTTACSIEEISTKIMATLHITRKF